MWVNRPLQVNQLCQLSLSSFPGRYISSMLQLDVRSGGQCHGSGECLRGEGLVWLTGEVVCSLAAYRGSNCSLARAMDGCISSAAPLALVDQLPLR